MEEGRTSGEEKRKGLKERIVREKGWYVPSIHGKHLERETRKGRVHEESQEG